MGLDVIWRNEHGDELGAFCDQQGAFAQAAVEVREREYPNLGRIDDYRTTHLAPSDALVGLLRRAAIVPGTYLELIGD